MNEIRKRLGMTGKQSTHGLVTINRKGTISAYTLIGKVKIYNTQPRPIAISFPHKGIYSISIDEAIAAIIEVNLPIWYGLDGHVLRVVQEILPQPIYEEMEKTRNPLESLQKWPCLEGSIILEATPYFIKYTGHGSHHFGQVVHWGNGSYHAIGGACPYMHSAEASTVDQIIDSIMISPNKYSLYNF
jgi:hypothetical protein